jgi:hypothetical protein
VEPRDRYSGQGVFLLCHDWLTAEFPFAERIVGVLFSVKPPYSRGCQIWVDDGFKADLVRPRWQQLMEWLRTRGGGVRDPKEDLDLVVQIEFRVHPTYQRYRADANDVKKESNEIPGFGQCIDLVLGNERAADSPPPAFDLEVARTHKRKWFERRRPVAP